MGTKMKGLLKGLRYISQIFDEDEVKDNEIQIGYPTDVKHVAHIGLDGPSEDSASWMKEFKSPTESDSTGDPKGNPEQKLVSQESSVGETHDLQKPSRRRSSSGEKSESPQKESSRRHSRKHMTKEPGEQSVKSSRKSLDSATTTDSAGGQVLESSPSGSNDIPKKSNRRKKSRENFHGLTPSSKPSRSKDTAAAGGGSVRPRKDDQVSQNSSMKNHTQEEGVGNSEIS